VHALASAHAKGKDADHEDARDAARDATLILNGNRF
jgi:hypothetical protein